MFPVDSIVPAPSSYPVARTRQAPLPNRLFEVVVKFLELTQCRELADGLYEFPEFMQQILWTALFTRQYPDISRLGRQLLFQHGYDLSICQRVQAQFYAVKYSLPLNVCQTLEGHAAKVTCLTTDRRGLLVSGSANGTIRVWNAEGKCKRVLKVHKRQVTCLAPLPLPGGFLSGSRDGTIRRWNVVEPADVFDTGGESVTCLLALSDGEILSGGNLFGNLCLRDHNGRFLRTISGHKQTVNHLTLLLDGRPASGSDDQTIRVWTRDFTGCTVLTSDTAAITGLITLRNGWLVSASHNGKIYQWNIDSGRTRVIRNNRCSVDALTPLTDRRFASSCVGAPNGRSIRLWTPEGCESASVLFDGTNVHAMTAMPGGRLALASNTSHNGKNIYLLNTELDPLRLVNAAIARANVNPGEEYPVTCVTQLYDKQIVSGSRQPRIHRWTEAGYHIDEYVEHENDVTCLAALPIGCRYILASGSADHTVRFWNSAFNEVLVVEAHSDPVIAMTVTHDGCLVSASDGRIWMWGWTRDGYPIQHLKIDHAVTCLSPWKEGGFAAGSSRGAIDAWDRNGRYRKCAVGHRSAITGLVSTAHGDLVSSSEDCNVLVWSSGLTDVSIKWVHPNPVTCLTMNGQGIIVTGTNQNELYYWNYDGTDVDADPFVGDNQVNDVKLLDDGKLLLATANGLVAGHLVDNPY